jgi:hypothetical protein
MTPAKKLKSGLSAIQGKKKAAAKFGLCSFNTAVSRSYDANITENCGEVKLGQRASSPSQIVFNCAIFNL